MRERVNKVIEHVNKLREDVEHSAEHEMLNDLRMGKIEQMEKKLKKRFNDHCRRIEHTKEEVEQRFDDRCQKIEETQEEVEQRFDDRCQKTEKTQEEMEKRFDNRCQKIEEAQEEVEQRFDDRCQKMEETQRKIVEVRVSYPRRQRNMLISSRRLSKSSLAVLQSREALHQPFPTL